MNNLHNQTHMSHNQNDTPVDEKEAVKQAIWMELRSAEVEAAVARRDEGALRRLSAQPGGFGSKGARRKAWIELLHVDQLLEPPPTPATRPTTPAMGGGEEEDDDADRHRDEDQVLLDTRRAFVTYPRGLSASDKAAMQEDLQELICEVLRQHPKLNYFQGFHDIMTVLYLTLLTNVPRPRTGETAADKEEWQKLVRAAEVVSLCRTRDAMGKGLGPMMGLLRLLRRLLAAADPQLFRISSSISPVPTLPFFALSWILTLFSHDVDTLEPVQRIFDYLIARNPISAIYLAVAILMSKKRQMLRLVSQIGPEARQDPSLLHPLFQRLPPLYPDTPAQPSPPPGYQAPDSPHGEPNPYTPLPLSTIFQLADRLQAKYPWNGAQIKGYEVMGPGSTVCTYGHELREDDEKGVWTLADAESAIDMDVVLPGGDDLDDDETLRQAPWLPGLGLRLFPNNRIGAAFCIGCVILGVGTALFGWRGKDEGWARWWAIVAHQWLNKSHRLGDNLRLMKGYLVPHLQQALPRALREL